MLYENSRCNFDQLTLSLIYCESRKNSMNKGLRIRDSNDILVWPRVASCDVSESSLGTEGLNYSTLSTVPRFAVNLKSVLDSIYYIL